MAGLRLSPRWVGRGLLVVVRGDQWITRDGARRMPASGSPRPIETPQGRVTGFGATDAGNTTGRLDGFAIRNSVSGPRSYFGVILARSTGGGALGRVMQDSTNAGANNVGEEAIYFIGGRQMLSKVGNTTNTPLQVGPTPTTPLGSWSTFGFSCNFVPGAAQAGADIACYQNGTLQTNTVNAAGGQVYPEFASANPVFGNRASDSARTWDGQIGILAVFDATLTAAEQASLHADPRQLFDADQRLGWMFPVVSGGTVYDVTVLDTAGAVDLIVGRLDGYITPSTDVTANGWVPTNAATVAAALASRGTSKYGTSPDLAASYTGEWQDPVPAGARSLVFTAQQTATAGQLRIVMLDSSNAVQGTSAWQTLSSSIADYTLAVTTTGVSTRFRIEVQP